MASRDEFTDSSRDGSGQQQKKDVGYLVNPFERSIEEMENEPKGTHPSYAGEEND